MESSQWDPATAAEALDRAEGTRRALTAQLRPGRGFFVLLGLFVTLHIVVAAVAIARQDLALLVAAGALFAVPAGAEMLWSRRANGVWVSDFAREVVLGTGTSASTAYVLGLGAATWAAFVDAWSWVGLAAVVAGVAYALAGHLWLRRYRECS